VSDSCNSQLAGSRSLVVLNGQYYCGENKEDNKLVFHPERAKAVAIDERRLRFIVQSIYYWFRSGEIQLQRLEILKVGDSKNVSVS
jgi:5-keto 4-deoxyuronate isomerase